MNSQPGKREHRRVEGVEGFKVLLWCFFTGFPRVEKMSGFPYGDLWNWSGFLLSFQSIKWQKNYKDSSEGTEFQSSPYFYLPANWLVKTWMGNWNTLTMQNSKPHRSWFWEWLETWNHTLHSLQFSTCRKWFVCFFPAPLPQTETTFFCSSFWIIQKNNKQPT